MPLRTIFLGVNGIKTAALGFGGSSLFRVSSPAERRGLLQTAHDCGIRHFDVVPMYGLGRAHAFARACRAELAIAARLGIKPEVAAQGLSYAQGPLRCLFAVRPMLRLCALRSACVEVRFRKLNERGKPQEPSRVVQLPRSSGFAARRIDKSHLVSQRPALLLPAEGGSRSCAA
jgi:hypothetical protein